MSSKDSETGAWDRHDDLLRVVAGKEKSFGIGAFEIEMQSVAKYPAIGPSILNDRLICSKQSNGRRVRLSSIGKF